MFSKHASYIKKCYPVRAEENQSIPRQSELAYLTFYATSRPEKLKKIGIYLEVRVKSYVWNLQDAYLYILVFDLFRKCLVTLQILNALLDACSHEAHFIAKNVLVMLTDMIHAARTALTVDIAHTFIVFCKHHTGTLMDVDQEYTGMYNNLVNQFCRLCFDPTQPVQPSEGLRWLGGKVLLAVVSSPATHSTDAKAYMRRVVPALVANINDPVVWTQFEQADEDVANALLLQRETTTEADLNRLSMHCLQKLVAMSSALNVKLAVVGVVRFLDEYDRWIPRQFAVDLIQSLLGATQSQNRFVVVAELLSQLDMCRQGIDGNKQLALANCVHVLLLHGVTFVGISVLEVLNTLLTQLLKSINSRLTTEEKVGTAVRVEDELITCIRALGQRVYYAGQVGDVVECLVKKLRRTEGEGTEKETAVLVDKEHLVAILDCIVGVLQTSREAEATGEFGVRFAVPVDVLEEQLLPLMLHHDPDVRQRIFFTFHTFMDDVTGTNAKGRKMTTHVTVHHALFRYRLHQQLFTALQSPQTMPQDILMMHQLFVQSLKRFQEDEVVKCLPLMFTLFKNIPTLKDNGRKTALLALIIDYVRAIGETMTINELAEYGQSMKADVQESNLWPTWWDAYFAQSEWYPPTDLSYDSIDSFHLNWLDKSRVIAMVSADARFQAQYSDVDKRLKMDFNQMTPPKGDDGGNEALKSKIRSSRNLDLMKPKFIAPIAPALDARLFAEQSSG
jgi:hypothetical protein